VVVPGGLEILNPELHIAELSDSKAELDIEFWVEVGTGYVPTEEQDRPRRGVDVMPVDALYSPVKRATFAVEPTRLGRRTDLDRLVLELYGNGAVRPEEAIHDAAKILSSYISIFLGDVEEEIDVTGRRRRRATRRSSGWTRRSRM